MLINGGSQLRGLEKIKQLKKQLGSEY